MKIDIGKKFSHKAHIKLENDENNPPGANAWVNTPMRIMEWQQSIKQQVKKYIEWPVSIEDSGSDWGMACNSIHNIDLISWLIDSI